MLRLHTAYPFSKTFIWHLEKVRYGIEKRQKAQTLQEIS